MSLLWLPNAGAGQAMVFKNNEPMFILDQTQAANIDYWARKGVASEPLINSLELEMKLFQERISTQDLLLRNNNLLMGACNQENDRLTAQLRDLETRLRSAETDLTIYKDRAQRRGQTIGIMIGAIAAVTAGVILLQ